MRCALTGRLSLALLRRPRRHVWRRPGDSVLLRSRLRRMVGLPRLLLRLRTRRGSGVLCRLRTRSVVYLRRWLRRPRSGVLLGSRLRRMVCLPRLLLRLRTRRGSGVLCRLRTRSVVYLRCWLRRRAVVCHRVRMRNVVVLRRTRHVLRSSRLLVVLWRSRRLSCVVRVGRCRRPACRRELRSRCSTGVQLSRPWRCAHGRPSLVMSHKLRRVFSGCLLVLHLRRGCGQVTLMRRG